MKNILKVIGIACLIVGCVMGCLSTIPVVDGSAIALDACGLAILIGTTLKKAEKKTWKEYVSIALFVVAGVCLGIAGVAEETISTLISTVAGLVALIIGILSTVYKKND